MIVSSSKCSLASARGFILELDRIKGVGSYLTATAEIDDPRKVRGSEKKLLDSLLTPTWLCKERHRVARKNRISPWGASP